MHDFAYADVGFDGYDPPSILQAEGAKECAVELYSMTKSFSMAGWRVRVHGRQRRGRAGAREAEELPRLRHVPAHPDRRHGHDERGAGLPEGGLRDLPEPAGRAVDGLAASAGTSRSRRGRCSSGRRSPSPTRSWTRSSSARCSSASATSPCRPGVGFGPGGEGFVRFALIENEQRIAQGAPQPAPRPHQALTARDTPSAFIAPVTSVSRRRAGTSVPSPRVHRFVVRVWLPDRPGALGQVASRIGAVRGDVVGHRDPRAGRRAGHRRAGRRAARRRAGRPARRARSPRSTASTSRMCGRSTASRPRPAARAPGDGGRAWSRRAAPSGASTGSARTLRERVRRPVGAPSSHAPTALDRRRRRRRAAGGLARRLPRRAAATSTPDVDRGADDVAWADLPDGTASWSWAAPAGPSGAGSGASSSCWPASAPPWTPLRRSPASAPRRSRSTASGRCATAGPNESAGQSSAQRAGALDGRAATSGSRRRRGCGRRPGGTRRRAARPRRSRRASPRRPRPARPGRPRRAPSSPGSTGRRTGTPSWSACSCSSRSITAAPPSTRSSLHLACRDAGHRLDHVAGLVRHRLDDGPGEVGAGRAAGDADHRAPGVRVPPRAAEAGEGRHDVRRRRCRAPTRPAGRSRPRPR